MHFPLWFAQNIRASMLRVYLERLASFAMDQVVPVARTNFEAS